MNVRRLVGGVCGCLIVGSLLGCGGGKLSKDGAKKDGRFARRRYQKSFDREPVAKKERYAELVENRFQDAALQPLSTFSVDVDTASYANIRRMLRDRIWPDSNAVRIEEMINYFRYNYPQPDGDRPFSVSLAAADCPWNPKHQVVRIGLQGRSLNLSQRPACNLVFLLDVSGSMRGVDKLPLVQAGLRLLVERLSPRDRVAIVVYAGATGLVLPSTPATERRTILRALDKLRAGGSTNGGQGLRLAYHVAEQNRTERGINRVILCTDGDFNVGTTGDQDLVDLVTRKAKSGVTLSVLGFGRGNLNDSMMEKVTNAANGNYSYIDTLSEAHKVLVQEATSTLVTIAKDVKIQVDFNPAYVKQYRLIGYENRMLQAEDFKDDRKDAGDIGAGHQVTALYEVIPPGQPGFSPRVDPSEFQTADAPVSRSDKPTGKPNGKMLTVRLRWKEPRGMVSREARFGLTIDEQVAFQAAEKDFRFSTAVAAMGLVLRDSEFKGSANMGFVVETAQACRGKDDYGYRQEFVRLARRAQQMRTQAE